MTKLARKGLDSPSQLPYSKVVQESRRALVVEDERNISHLITFHLEKIGFAVTAAYSGEEALEAIRSFKPSIVVLDIMLPGISGLQVCQYIKSHEEYRDIPIVILSALGEEDDVVKGLETGADDYLPKPFSPKLLKARIQSVMRRYPLERGRVGASDLVEYKGIQIDKRRHRFSIDAEQRELTATEFAILLLLLEQKGVVFTRSQIVNAIRGDNHAITDRSVDFQMVGLRRKLAPYGELIESVRGVGYRFCDDELE